MRNRVITRSKIQCRHPRLSHHEYVACCMSFTEEVVVVVLMIGTSAFHVKGEKRCSKNIRLASSIRARSFTVASSARIFWKYASTLSFTG